MTHEWRSDRAREAEDYEVFFREHDDAARTARGWYHRSRQGMQGPFASREEAERDYARLMNTDIWGLEDGSKD